MRKALLALVTSILLVVSSVLGGSAATAAAKLPVKMTFLKSIQVPSGSQDFHFVSNAQGGQLAQWVVKSTTNNVDTWQIWIADFEPTTGALLNQTKAYELPAGTSFLSKPVISNFPNSVGIVYSTYWSDGSGIHSEVEALTFGANGFSARQVVQTFPRINITPDSPNFGDCIAGYTQCGYQKVAIGGDSSFQTTIAVLDFQGDQGATRIGFSSSAYFRNVYWTDPVWIAADSVFNFEISNSFTWGSSHGVYFTYVQRVNSNSIAVRKITFDSRTAVQTVSDPTIVSRIVGGSRPQLTFINGNQSVVTWVNSDYSTLAIWVAYVDTQFDGFSNDSVVWSSTHKYLGSDWNYRVGRVSTESFQVVVPQFEMDNENYWNVDTVTVHTGSGPLTVSPLLKGDDFDTQAIIGDTHTSPDGSFGLSVALYKDASTIGAVMAYSPDFGLIPVPVKAKKATILSSTIYGSFYDSSLISFANIQVGAQQFLEVTRLRSKVPPTSTVNVRVYGSREVGGAVSVTSPGWSSYSYVGATSYQWLRCSARIPVKVVGIPKVCKKIIGSNQSGYTLTAADRGKYVTVLLSAQNINGPSTLIASSTKVIR